MRPVLPWPERPRERLSRAGAAHLATAELLALVLRSGAPGLPASAVADQLVRRFDSLERLAAAGDAELSRVAVELNARIAEVAHSAGVALSDEAVAPIPTPDLAGDESFIDLTADSPARARTGSDPTPGADSSRRTSGWQPVD